MTSEPNALGGIERQEGAPLGRGCHRPRQTFSIAMRRGEGKPWSLRMARGKPRSWNRRSKGGKGEFFAIGFQRFTQRQVARAVISDPQRITIAFTAGRHRELPSCDTKLSLDS